MPASGNVTVLELIDGDWTEAAVLHGSSYFGSSVALAGNNLLVGSPYEGLSHTNIYIFLTKFCFR